ncbi:MAG TPA: aminotransferase class V-fold PLP-dependent enzyme [Myxococcaceae bacterium]|nr:aminotransferase class V-fold PLP-dependent enzyme [Myxococcaceae bacterium]
MPETEFARHWLLDPGVDFLNHGSFGACPRPVLEAQQQLREELERQPIRFMLRDLPGRLALARKALGSFVGADPDDLAFVSNATTGANTVLRSLRFEAGDELITTNQAYNACRNALTAAASRDGATLVVADVPFPVRSPAEVVEAILGRVTSRTRLVLLDHVTSPTGVVWPVKQIVGALAGPGIDTLVDGAHAPGMLPLNVEDIGAAYYSGNCHKWICAPKGAAFLHVRRDRQHRIRPLTISHGANSTRRDVSRFRLEFDWVGTQDFTPFLCVPEALRFMGSLLPGGWSELMEHNHQSALRARNILGDALQAPPPCPDEMIGSLATVALPDGEPASPRSALEIDPLQDALFEKFHLEVPVVSWPAPPKRWVRVSSQIYNTDAQYRRLASALRRLLAG